MASVWDIMYQCFAALYPHQRIGEILHLVTDENTDIIGFIRVASANNGSLTLRTSSHYCAQIHGKVKFLYR